MTSSFTARLEDVVPAAPRDPARPWSALVCGAPGSAMLVVVDWLMLAARAAGCTARAVPLEAGVDAPYGMYVEVAPVGADLDASAVPWTDVDLLVAGDHGELARALAFGFGRADVTTIVASCARSFTDAERAMLPSHVLDERSIDRVASAAAARYVAFDAEEVRGWYRLPEGCEPGLLVGAALGAGALPVPGDALAAAIQQLGLGVRAGLAGLERGQRFGRRGGGRVRRTLTAGQFVRTRRARLPRGERAAFEALVERVEHELQPQQRAAVREGIALLCDYDSVEYAGRLVDGCIAVARSEQAAAPGRVEHDSVVPVVARNLAAILAYPDAAWVAQRKLERGRLQAIRRFHGIDRDTPFSVRELIPIDAWERHQLAPEWRRSRQTEASPLLGAARVERIDSTTVRGALRLRRLRSLRKHRATSPRHVLELDTADAYVAVVRETFQRCPELVSLVAASGALVQGYGAVRVATRATAETFWGRVVRQAFAIDHASPDRVPHASLLLVPHVYRELSSRGPVALWDYAAQAVGIALHQARGGTYEQALGFVRALCGMAQPEAVAPAPAPADPVGDPGPEPAVTDPAEAPAEQDVAPAV